MLRGSMLSKNGACCDALALKYAAEVNTRVHCLKKMLEVSSLDANVIGSYIKSTFGVEVDANTLRQERKRGNRKLDLMIQWYISKMSWPWRMDNNVSTALKPSISRRLELPNYLVKLNKEHSWNNFPTALTYSNPLLKDADGTKQTFAYEDVLKAVLDYRNIGLHMTALDMSSEKVSKASSPGVSKRKAIANEQNHMLKAAVCANEVSGVLSMIIRGATVPNLERECIFRNDGKKLGLVSVEEDVSYFDMISKMNSSSGNYLWMPLHYAAYRSNEDMARLLVGNGANVNCQNVNGQTPLHCISMSSVRIDLEINYKRRRYRSKTLSREDLDAFIATEELVKIEEKSVTNASICTAFALLELGAAVNAQDKLGITPLHIAATRGDHKLASLLLLHGGDATIMCNDNSNDAIHSECGRFLYHGVTPMHIAVMEEYIPTVGAILFNPPLYGLSSQCDVHKFIKLESVDTLDANGRSALFYAIAKYNPSITGLLANAGANLNLRDNEGFMSIDMIDFSFETSTGPWGKWFFNLLVSNGAKLGKSIAAKHTKHLKELEEPNRVWEIRTLKLDEHRNKTVTEIVDDRLAHPLTFWAEPKISPFCFACGDGDGGSQPSTKDQPKFHEHFHCFYCGLLYCAMCSYAQIDGEKTFPRYVSTSNGDNLKARVCKNCILLFI